MSESKLPANSVDALRQSRWTPDEFERLVPTPKEDVNSLAYLDVCDTPAYDVDTEARATVD